MPNPSDSERYRDILNRLAQFGTLSDAEVAERLSTGLAGFLGRWEQEVLPFVAAGGAELRFVEGPNGRGKTHFLQALEVVAQRAGFATSRIECGMDHTPFASLQETYRAIATTMRAGLLGQNGSGTGVGGVLGGLSTERMAEFMKAPRGNPAFRNLVIACARRAHSGFQRDQVTLDLRALLHHDTNRRVTFRDLFDGAKNLGTNLQRPLGRVGKRNAAVWLRSLLALPRQLGFKGLEKILVSMRVLLDAPDQRMERLALFGVFAAVPDIIQQMKPAQFLSSRFQVVVPFHNGDNNAPVMDLSELGKQNEMLRAMGEKLLQLGVQAHEWKVNLELQRRNLRRLADVTAGRRLEVNARRLYVKAWCSLLEEQMRNGEVEKTEVELANLIDGVYAGFKQAEQSAKEEDLG